MFILLFLLWIVFNANFTLEIVLFGLGVAGLVYAFMCAFMDFSIKKDLFLMSRVPLFIAYVGILIWEVIKANLVLVKLLVIKRENELHPVIFKIQTGLRSKLCRVLLANSITLTPGTITVSMEGDVLIIHAMDQSLAIEDMEHLAFEGILEKLEGGHKA